uniref:Uncharacterized protein n=1 Tax=Calidris pygmaea TaxID=425635 RepID=A0A8C3JYV1_9CHAR
MGLSYWPPFKRLNWCRVNKQTVKETAEILFPFHLFPSLFLKRIAVMFYLLKSLLLKAEDRMAFSSCASLSLTKHFCVSLSV